jgi:hypothetical protein
MVAMGLSVGNDRVSHTKGMNIENWLLLLDLFFLLAIIWNFIFDNLVVFIIFHLFLNRRCFSDVDNLKSLYYTSKIILIAAIFQILMVFKSLFWRAVYAM